MTSKDKMSKEERVTKALILKQKGLTDEEIAEKLDVRRETINRYLNQEADHIHKKYSAKKQEELLDKFKQEIHTTFSYKRRKLYELIEDNECTDSVKLGALKELTRDVKEKHDILVKMGIVEDHTDDENIEVTPEEVREVREFKRTMDEAIEEVRKSDIEDNQDEYRDIETKPKRDLKV